MDQTKDHKLQQVVPQGQNRWMAPVVVVKPKRSKAEIELLKPSGHEHSTGSGTMVSQCHALTNMHVLFHPADELSFGREMTRRAEVLGTASNGDQLIASARIVMQTEAYWMTKDKEEAKRMDLTYRQYHRDHEDIALLKLSPVVRVVSSATPQDMAKVVYSHHLGNETGWFPMASHPPPASTIFAGIGANTGIFVSLGTLEITRSYHLFYDKECRARHLDKYGFTIFKGTCHVVSGMSGGAIVSKHDKQLYGLIQGGVLSYDGAPPKGLTDDFFNDDKLANLPLNHSVAIWKHNARIQKVMREHPCERL